MRLAKFFGISADFWMNLQLRWDIYFAKQEEEKELEAYGPLIIRLVISIIRPCEV